MVLFDSEPSDGFRRNLIVVITVHVALLGALWLVSRNVRPVAQEQITWLDGSALGGAPSVEAALPPLPDIPAKPQEPEPEPVVPKPPEPEPIPADPPSKPPEPEPDPIVAPKPPPTPAPTRKPVAKTTPAPKSTPRPEVKKKATPPLKKVAKATPAPKPATRTGDTVAKPASAETAGAGDGSRAGAPNGSASGSVSAAELQNYFGAVGEEFRGCWKIYKPLFGERSGGNLTAMVHVRISSSGSVVEATLTGSTGNQEVDASIRKAFGDFKRVPAPPAALLKGGIFESNMAVILSI